VARLISRRRFPFNGESRRPEPLKVFEQQRVAGRVQAVVRCADAASADTQTSFGIAISPF
jgi:hypothetical protein